MSGTKLTKLEKELLLRLKEAFLFIEYGECFRGRLTSRNEMDEVLRRWREYRPSCTGIGVGATYLSDVEFHFDKSEKVIAEAEKINGGPLEVPKPWA